MWFANQEQMSNWILLSREEQGFFENLHREYWSKLEKREWERLNGGEVKEKRASRMYRVGHRKSISSEGRLGELVPRL